jgi:hypothetical protein
MLGLVEVAIRQATKISTAVITMTKRKALGTPFQSVDCHIPNH